MKVLRLHPILKLFSRNAMKGLKEGVERKGGAETSKIYGDNLNHFRQKRRIYEIRLVRVQSYTSFRICNATLVSSIFSRMQYVVCNIQYAANFRGEIPKLIATRIMVRDQRSIPCTLLTFLTSIFSYFIFNTFFLLKNRYRTGDRVDQI